MGLFGSISKLVSSVREIVDEVDDRENEWSPDMESTSFFDQYQDLAASTETSNTFANLAKQQAEQNMAALRQAAETATQQALASETRGQALQTLANATLAQAESNVRALEGTLSREVNTELNNVSERLQDNITENLGGLAGSISSAVLPVIVSQLTNVFNGELDKATRKIIDELKK